MSEFVQQALPGSGEVSTFAYLLVFLAGILTSAGPCNLSMVPVIMGFVAGQKELTRKRGFWLSLLFTLGSSATFVLLGLIAAAIGVLSGPESKLLHWFAAAVCILIGLNLLGALHIRFDLFARLLPQRPLLFGPIGAFLLGLVVGLAGSQCGTPVLVAILGAVVLKGKLVVGALLLFTYGMGRGVPIVLAGTFTGILRALPTLERWSLWMNRAAGVVLILVGLYFVWIA